MSEEEHLDFIQYIRGYPVPLAERFKKKNFEDTMDMVPEDGDVIVSSYPKTGTTWVQYIVIQILSRGECFPSFDDLSNKVGPYLELVGVASLVGQTKPRFYKHHIAYNYVQKNEKSKVIYAYRNPEDTLVSYFNFLRDMETKFELDFDKFFDGFVSGKTAYGSYFRHFLSFYEHRNDPNLMMVSYENLKTNPKEQILRIAKFIGEEYHRTLLEDGELLNGILHRTSFDYMKKNLELTHPDITAGVRQVQTGEEKPMVNFFRKGIVGEGKAVLTDSQRQTLKEAAVKILKGNLVLSEWYGDERIVD